MSNLEIPNLIVPTDWLAENLDAPDLHLLDVRSAENYALGHIPGAVRVELSHLSGVVGGVPGMVLPPDLFAQVMGQLGVDQEKRVVIYDDNWGMPAARVLWSLHRYGHAHAAVLNGGWDRWIQEDRPTTTEVVAPPQTEFKIKLADEYLAERDWILNQNGNPDLVLVDTRGANEFAQGHLPQAVRWDWISAVPQGSWDTIRPAGELRAELEAAGITPDKTVITYCRSGARAAHTYMVLRHLGYPDVRNYDGSWLDWAIYLRQQARQS